MSLQAFTDICETLAVERSAVSSIYNQDTGVPCVSDDDAYDADQREFVEAFVFDAIFQEDQELDIETLASRINANREQMAQKHPDDGPIWSTVGNIQIAAARAAAQAFRVHAECVMETKPDINFEALLAKVARPPYRRMSQADLHGFPTIDHVATKVMYARDLIALLIARRHGFEEFLPKGKTVRQLLTRSQGEQQESVIKS